MTNPYKHTHTKKTNFLRLLLNVKEKFNVSEVAVEERQKKKNVEEEKGKLLHDILDAIMVSLIPCDSHRCCRDISSMKGIFTNFSHLFRFPFHLLCDKFFFILSFLARF